LRSYTRNDFGVSGVNHPHEYLSSWHRVMAWP
jgi:hypothetical protein